MLFEEIVEAAGGNRLPGAEFLCKKRNLEFLDKPTEFAEKRKFVGIVWLFGGPFLPGFDKRLGLLLAFLIFGEIQRSAFGPDAHH